MPVVYALDVDDDSASPISPVESTPPVSPMMEAPPELLEERMDFNSPIMSASQVTDAALLANVDIPEEDPIREVINHEATVPSLPSGPSWEKLALTKEAGSDCATEDYSLGDLPDESRQAVLEARKQASDAPLLGSMDLPIESNSAEVEASFVSTATGPMAAAALDTEDTSPGNEPQEAPQDETILDETAAAAGLSGHSISET